MERIPCEKGQRYERMRCVQGNARSLMRSECSCMGGNERVIRLQVSVGWQTMKAIVGEQCR